MQPQDETPKTYGTLTVGTGGPEQRELTIVNVVRAEYADDRIISIMGIEDGTIIVQVENPSATGRNPQQSMWLSREILIGILCTTHMHLSSTGSDLMQLVKDAVGDETIRYSFGGTNGDPGKSLPLPIAGE